MPWLLLPQWMMKSRLCIPPWKHISRRCQAVEYPRFVKHIGVLEMDFEQIWMKFGYSVSQVLKQRTVCYRAKCIFSEIRQGHSLFCCLADLIRCQNYTWAFKHNNKPAFSHFVLTHQLVCSFLSGLSASVLPHQGKSLLLHSGGIWSKLPWNSLWN